jgi:hypothetical protein
MWEAIIVLGHSVRRVNMEDQHIKVKVRVMEKWRRIMGAVGGPQQDTGPIHYRTKCGSKEMD